MKLKINKDQVNQLFIDVRNALAGKGWVSVKEINFQKLYQKNNIPPTGLIARYLTDWLTDNKYIAKLGKRLINYKITDKYLNDIDSIVDNYLYYINNNILSKETTVKSEIPLDEYPLGKKVFILLNNSIFDGIIVETRKHLNNDNKVLIKYRIKVPKYDEGYVDMEHDIISTNIDSLLNRIKEQYINQINH